MVKTSSSSGKFVNVEIKGIAEVIKDIQSKHKKLIDASQISTVQAANYVQQEVQESIIGNRAEPKSVNTGKFGNNIEVEMVSETTYVIKPSDSKYTGTNTSVQDVAKFMEYGTTKITPRRHFRNTKLRVEPKIVEKFKKNINIALK